MAQGLQIFDASGNNTLDTTSGTMKILGNFTGRVDTTVVSPLFSTETPFYIILPRKRYGHEFISISFVGDTCRIVNNEFESSQGAPTIKYTVYVGVY